MKRILLLASCGLALAIFSAGCTSPTDSIFGPTATPTTLPAEVPTSSPETLSTPEAVATLPAELFVDLSLSKERPDATIHLLYNGGPGAVSVQNVLMRVTGSDGQVTEEYLNNNARKPRQGDELVIQGTRGSDRVEVWVTSAGKIYKVIDQPLVSLQ